MTEKFKSPISGKLTEFFGRFKMLLLPSRIRIRDFRKFYQMP